MEGIEAGPQGGETEGAEPGIEVDGEGKNGREAPRETAPRRDEAGQTAGRGRGDEGQPGPEGAGAGAEFHGPVGLFDLGGDEGEHRRKTGESGPASPSPIEGGAAPGRLEGLAGPDGPEVFLEEREMDAPEEFVRPVEEEVLTRKYEEALGAGGPMAPMSLMLE